MKTTLIICMIILLMLNSCGMFLKDCPDEVSHSFTKIDSTFFSFELNDTIHYKDKNSAELYYLTCVYKKITSRDSGFATDENCINGGYWNIEDDMNFKLFSNLPHFENKYAQINIYVTAIGNPKSLVSIEFFDRNLHDYEDSANVYRYYLSFDNKQVKIIKHPWFSISSKINQFDQLVINGINYSNVFSISYDTVNSPYPHKSVFDTIYYNEKGFLKFISSQHGYNIERRD